MATEGLQVSSDGASELGSDSSPGRVAKRRARIQTVSQLSDLKELSVQLGAMVDNPEYSNIIFVCNDGVQVRASRMMLTARSSVMLGSGMVESKSEQIRLPNLSSVALLPALEFLYAGDFHKYAPKGYATLEVMRAAQYLLLPRLERRVFNLAVLHLESLREDYEMEALEQNIIDLFCVAAIDADSCLIAPREVSLTKSWHR